ncbi:MAG: thiamine biosynthesis protein ThiJ [Phenylobacterium sp.]|uniref:DJ-1/PfpI family protein n=1 Tax=Phenylobacterium sp. TaxID=1871053 RepID=UPI0025DC8E79|nr:DJ-1/PfpI family protein [Phenylobacterium sp.]MBA4014084.1 thiamine biosynthesis protein ThiJ [Phenylobacterium sp.]
MRRLVASILALVTLLFAGAAAARPYVVVLADARGTVATDLLAPYAILAESGAVDVAVASATSAPVRLTPGVAWVSPQATLTQLSRSGRRPDVIIVPAMSIEDDPARSAWLRRQVEGGARVMSICNGAKVLAAAGLLDGRQAVIHWYSRKPMRKAYPRTTWREDLRWVSDGPVTTTAGISAGEPATLHLLGELAGKAVMRETAERLQLPMPQAGHNGQDYRLTLPGMTTVVLNRLAFWRRETVAVPLAENLDELAFGTALDAWSRTYRSRAWASGPPTVRTRHGLLVYRSAETPARFAREVVLQRPDVMTNTFREIATAYGVSTARFVALQFEHPAGAVDRS